MASQVTKEQAGVPYTARALAPAHGDLARSAGVPAQVANEQYIEALARVVYYWAYPAIDIMTRTSQWEVMKDGPGAMLGIFPAGPVNTSGCLSDYMPPSQRMVVTPNNDTIYMSSFTDLGREPAVIQTPTKAPKGHYWTIQVADVFANVIYQLGSAAGTPGGKYLLVGPEWNGQKPDEFLDVLRMPTNIAWVPGRSFAAHTPESKAESLAVLGQMRVYPLSQNKPGAQNVDCQAVARNVRFPAAVTAEMIAADPEAFRPEWVNPRTFWEALEKFLAANPRVGPSDAAMAGHAHLLRCARPSRMPGRCSTVWCSPRTPRGTPAVATSRWASMRETVGSARRMAGYGEAIGSGAPRPPSSTSWSTTTTRPSTSFAEPTRRALCSTGQCLRDEIRKRRTAADGPQPGGDSGR
jgi:hypothetical protein